MAMVWAQIALLLLALLTRRAESLTEALYLASARAALEQERAATRRLLGSHHTDPFPRPHEMCGPGTLEYGSKTVYAPMYVANALVSNQEACRENLRGRIVARTYENERRIAAEAAAKAKADSAFLAKQAAFVGSHPHGTVGVHTKWTGHGAANPKLFSTEPTLRLSTPYRKLPLWQGNFETVQRDRAAKKEIVNQHRKAKIRGTIAKVRDELCPEPMPIIDCPLGQKNSYLTG